MLSEKLKDTILAVLPVVVIVFLMNFTVVSIPWPKMGLFFIGGIFIAVGLALFLVGVDLGITPFGAHLGAFIARKNKLLLLIVAGLILGFFISFAEPGLLILANEIDAISAQTLPSITTMTVVSAGIAVMMVVGFLRIVYNLPLYILLNAFYLLVLILSFFSAPEFLAIAFDASGATTGVLAVPFILSLSLGISALKKDSKSSEKDSFGLVAITSVGAILAVLVLNMVIKVPIHDSLPFPNSGDLVSEIAYGSLFIMSFKESAMAFLPMTVLYIAFALFAKDLRKQEKRRILFGFAYAFIGLAIFFIGVYGGFMEVGSLIGNQLSRGGNNTILLLVGFILGVVTIIAEPAVYVLTHQIEEVTAGYVKRRSVLLALAGGVGVAVAMSMLRIITPSLQLWHYLLPGYILSLLLTFIVPKLFVGIAFDAGGVATGPMTATFILALTNGAANSYATADIIRDGFGMIAMVAMMPIISIQFLGLVFKLKSRKKGVDNIDT